MSLTNERILEEVCEEYGATYYWGHSSSRVHIAIRETGGGGVIDHKVIWSISRLFFYPVNGGILRGMLEKRLVEGILHNMGGNSGGLINLQISPEHLAMKREMGVVTAAREPSTSRRVILIDFIDQESRSTLCSPLAYNPSIWGGTLAFFNQCFEAKLEKIREERG